MKDDMRLKCAVVKGPKAGVIPCLLTCDKSKSCPCADLQTYLSNQSTGDITSIELEWMHIPSWKHLVFWMKLIPSVTIAVLLIVIVSKLKMDKADPKKIQRNDTSYKVVVTDKGYSLECATGTVQDFEASSNDVARLKKDLQSLCAEGGK